jgi:hypothetical protein
MMTIRLIDKGKIGGRIDEDEARSRITGHAGSRRVPDVGSR